MSAIEVRGLCPIKGEITVQGSKNAVLPMMAGAVLNNGITVINNVPRIQDVFCMLGILDSIGCKCRLEGNRLKIDASELQRRKSQKVCEEYALLDHVSGPLLGRMKRAVTSFPGGCSIGERPIDLHLAALDAMGAIIEKDGEELKAVTGQLTGADIHFPFPSVGATENALMAAVLAEGDAQERDDIVYLDALPLFVKKYPVQGGGWHLPLPSLDNL